jgi:drug/metabolite transporter (DMT)-like permease
VSIGAAILVPLALSLGHSVPRTRREWRDYAVMAILNNVVPFTIIVWAQQHITAGLASVLNATVPLWAVLLNQAFGTERLTANRLAGVLIGVAGVTVLVGPEALAGNRVGLLGMLGMLFAAVCYGLSSVWARRFKGVPPMVSAGSQLTCATVMLLPLSLLFDQPWTLPEPSLAAIASLVGLGAAATAFAYVIFFHIMTVSGTSNAMLVTLLIPISAVAMGHFALGEAILARHILGGLVIGVALLVIDGRALPRVWRGFGAGAG